MSELQRSIKQGRVLTFVVIALSPNSHILYDFDIDLANQLANPSYRGQTGCTEGDLQWLRPRTICRQGEEIASVCLELQSRSVYLILYQAVAPGCPDTLKSGT